MAIKVNLAVAFMVAVALVQSSRAETSHVVGGSTGWIVPADSSTYTTWAASQTFAVGDFLIFNFATGAHDVAAVASKTAYDGCSSTNALSTTTTGPANITLTSGEHFYICTIANHCSSGQKLTITVSTNATSTPSPTGTNTTSSPPPPASAAQPLAVAAALPITLVSIVLALLH